MDDLDRFWPKPFVAGVSLTYDGSSEEQLDGVVPLLNQSGLKATFFADPGEMVGRIAGWRGVVGAGHEIGNCFLYSSVDEDGLIPDWQPETFCAEMEDAEALINEISPDRKHRSFALPCVRTRWGNGGLPVVERIFLDTIVRLNEEMLSPLIREQGFQGVRGPLQGFNDPKETDPMAVKCFVGDGMDAESLCTATHIGISQGSWVVLTFNALRGVELDLAAHAKFLGWLSNCGDAVAVETFGESARRVSARVDVGI